jgi:hypothetical protein
MDADTFKKASDLNIRIQTLKDRHRELKDAISSFNKKSDMKPRFTFYRPCSNNWKDYTDPIILQAIQTALEGMRDKCQYELNQTEIELERL